MKGQIIVGFCCESKVSHFKMSWTVRILYYKIIQQHMRTVQQKDFLVNLMGITYSSKKMYRGSPIKIDLGAKRTAWLTDDEKEATIGKYGKYMYVFKTAKPLKLINLSSWFFRFHFMDELNIHYGGKENHDGDVLREKLMTMIPIGLPISTISVKV